MWRTSRSCSSRSAARGAQEAFLRRRWENENDYRRFGESGWAAPERSSQVTFVNRNPDQFFSHDSSQVHYSSNREVDHMDYEAPASTLSDHPTWVTSRTAMSAYPYEPSFGTSNLTMPKNEDFQIAHSSNIYEQAQDYNNFFDGNDGGFLSTEQRSRVFRNPEYYEEAESPSNDFGRLASGSFTELMSPDVEHMPSLSLDDVSYRHSTTFKSGLHRDPIGDSLGNFEDDYTSSRVKRESIMEAFSSSHDYNRIDRDFSYNQNSRSRFNEIEYVSVNPFFTPEESYNDELPSRSSYFDNHDELSSRVRTHNFDNYEENLMPGRRSLERVRREPDHNDHENSSYCSSTFSPETKRYKVERFNDSVRRTTKTDYRSSYVEKSKPTTNFSNKFGEDCTSQSSKETTDLVAESSPLAYTPKARESSSIRTAHVKAHQLLYIYFEQAIRGFCKDIPAVEEIREKFQELWMLFAFQFFKRFWELFGFTVVTADSSDFSLEKLSPLISKTESSLQDRFNEITAQDYNYMYEFEIATTDKISEVIQRDTFNKKFSNFVTPMLLEAVCRDTPVGLGLVDAAEKDGMKFKCSVNVLHDLRENPPPGQCGVRMILLFSDDLDKPECLPKHIINRYRFLSTMIEKIGRKYIHNKIKQWLWSCKDFDTERFHKILAKLKRRRRGPQKWKKFRRKWRIEGLQLSHADIVYGVDKSVLSLATEDLPEETQPEISPSGLNKHIRFSDTDYEEDCNLILQLDDTKIDITSTVRDVVEEMIQQIEQGFIKPLETESEEVGAIKRSETNDEIECVEEMSISSDHEEEEKETNMCILDKASSTDSEILKESAEDSESNHGLTPEELSGKELNERTIAKLNIITVEDIQFDIKCPL